MYITKEQEASLKLYKRERSSTIDTYNISKLSIYTQNKITEAYPSRCIEGVTSCMFPDRLCMQSLSRHEPLSYANEPQNRTIDEPTN
jgi:hypothetical protein